MDCRKLILFTGGKMPIKKIRLSKADLSECRPAAQQLLEWGLISKMPKWLEIPPALDIHIDPMASVAAELPSGQVCYAIRVELVAREAGVMVDCRITTTWDDQIILGSDEISDFCRPSGPVDSLEDALNRRIENALRFRRRGDLIRGTIFFWGSRPIPSHLRTDAIVPFKLTFMDSLGNEFPAKGTLYLSRRHMQKKAIQKQSIFEGPVPDQVSIGERQRRAYCESVDKERANLGGSDPDQQLRACMKDKREFWSKMAQLSPPVPDQPTEVKWRTKSGKAKM